MFSRFDQLRQTTRRHFLAQSGVGLGAIALASLDKSEAAAAHQPARNPLTARAPHFKPRARRVIYLHMTGSPPHLDLFDYKPELVRRDGELCPAEFFEGKQFAFTSEKTLLMGTPRRFGQYGESGMWMSDAVPHLHEVADELCMIRSMTTDQFNHAPAELFLYTGSPRSARP